MNYMNSPIALMDECSGCTITSQFVVTSYVAIKALPGIAELAAEIAYVALRGQSGLKHYFSLIFILSLNLPSQDFIQSKNDSITLQSLFQSLFVNFWMIFRMFAMCKI